MVKKNANDANLEEKKNNAIVKYCELAKRIFNVENVEVIIGANSKILTDTNNLFNVSLDIIDDSGKCHGIFHLSNTKFRIFSAEEQQILNDLSSNLAVQLQAFSQIYKLNEELHQNRIELDIIHDDLNLAHEELNDAYNMTILLNRNLTKGHIRFKSFLEQAPIAFGVLRHRHLKIELANSQILRLWGKDKSVIGKRLSVALPELIGQCYLNILDDVYTTGKRYVGRESEVILNNNQGEMIKVYFNFIYEPLKNERGNTNAIMIIATDVTEQVTVRNELIETNKKLLGENN